MISIFGKDSISISKLDKDASTLALFILNSLTSFSILWARFCFCKIIDSFSLISLWRLSLCEINFWLLFIKICSIFDLSFNISSFSSISFSITDKSSFISASSVIICFNKAFILWVSLCLNEISESIVSSLIKEISWSSILDVSYFCSIFTFSSIVFSRLSCFFMNEVSSVFVLSIFSWMNLILFFFSFIINNLFKSDSPLEISSLFFAISSLRILLFSYNSFNALSWFSISFFKSLNLGFVSSLMFFIWSFVTLLLHNGQTSNFEMSETKLFNLLISYSEVCVSFSCALSSISSFSNNFIFSLRMLFSSFNFSLEGLESYNSEIESFICLNNVSDSFFNEAKYCSFSLTLSLTDFNSDFNI